MKTDKKKLVLQSILLLGLFTVIVVTVTVAWFNFSIVTDVKEYTLQARSAKNFSISLNGYNYGNEVNMKFVDDEDNAYIELRDVASVVSSQTIDGKPFTKLWIYNPTKSEYSGDPILNSTWDLANPTDIAYDGSTYYYPSNQSGDAADYIEFDIWIRADSKMDIYLGDQSFVEAVDESTDPNDDTIYAMYANESVTCAYSRDVYTKTLEVEGETITDSFSIVTYADYYEGKDNNLNPILLKNIYNYYYNSDNSSMFVVRDGDPDRYDSNGKTIIVETLSDSTNDTKLKNLMILVDEYLANPTSEDWTKVQDTTNSSSYRSETLYYNKDGGQMNYKKIQTVGLVGGVESFITEYRDLNGGILNNINVDVLKKSDYGQETYTYYLGDSKNCPISYVKHYFSKNLIVGAMRVSFSDITNGYEDLKYVWNPHPEYKYVVGSNGLATFSIDDENTDEQIQCFQRASSAYATTYLDDSFVLNGDPQTTEATPATGEVPLCSLETNTSGRYSIRKVRVRIWLEGLDSMASNSMLNSNFVGNGVFKMRLNLVSSEIKTEVTKTATANPMYYIVEANRVNADNNGFSWTVSNTNVADFAELTPELATELEITSLQANQKLLKFKTTGSVMVYATPNAKGVMGSTLVKYENIIITKTFYNSDANNNYYKLTADYTGGGDITGSTASVWKYADSDQVLTATTTTVEPIETYVLVSCPKTSLDMIVSVTYHTNNQYFSAIINIGDELVLTKTYVSTVDDVYKFKIDASMFSGENVNNESLLSMVDSKGNTISPVDNEGNKEYYAEFTSDDRVYYVDASYTYYGNVYTERIYLRGGN